MFDGLTQKLAGVFDRLRGHQTLTQDDVQAAMREIRVALLEADVALPVVKDFIATVSEKAVGQDLLKAKDISPADQIVKIVHDELVHLLGDQNEVLALSGARPAVVLMVGLQGSGKTTTSAKLALLLKKRDGKKVLMASLDIYRPAAQEQLATLGQQIEVDTLPIIPDEDVKTITQRALKASKDYDVLILDTAGRLHIDSQLMDEVALVRHLAQPQEILLTADAMIGQDAVTMAQAFHDKVGVTGLILTRLDGDARGGAALSMRSVTGCPIKFMGIGEKVDALEPFYPDRLAGRILGMGDVVSLVEKAQDTLDAQEAEALTKRMMDGQFTLEDMLSQLQQMKKMGSIKGLMKLLPGISKFQAQIDQAGIDDHLLKRQEAIILSMTPGERRNPDLILAGRRKRIAAGAGVSVSDVQKLLKHHEKTATVMKQMKKMGGMEAMLKAAKERGLDLPELPPGTLPPHS